MIHGTMATYKAGCSCEFCRAENARVHREQMRAYRGSQEELTPCPECGEGFETKNQGLSRHRSRVHGVRPVHHHGEVARYKQEGCRCRLCRSAAADSQARVRATRSSNPTSE